MRHQWKRGTGIVLGVQEGGQVRAADYRAFRKGDFVSVLASIDLSRKKKYNVVEARATFRPLQVIRLTPASPAIGRAVGPAPDITAEQNAVVPRRAQASMTGNDVLL